MSYKEYIAMNKAYLQLFCMSYLCFEIGYYTCW